MVSQFEFLDTSSIPQVQALRQAYLEGCENMASLSRKTSPQENHVSRVIIYFLSLHEVRGSRESLFQLHDEESEGLGAFFGLL